MKNNKVEEERGGEGHCIDGGKGCKKKKNGGWDYGYKVEMNCKVRGLRRERQINDSRDDKKIRKMRGEGEDCKIVSNEREIKGPTKADGGEKAAF